LHSFGWQTIDEKQLRQGAESMMAHYPVLRITIFPDGREWITGRSVPQDLTQRQNNGVCCSLTTPEISRCLAIHKTGNYLSAWLAKANAHNLGAEEAILVDAAGNWLETSTGNLWGWHDGSWWTPPTSVGILPGVVRSQLIRWLQGENLSCREEPWTVKLIEGFEAIAYSNSVVEIVPIHTVILPTGQLEYDPNHWCFQQLRRFFLAF